MFTGDASYSVAYLGIGERDSADSSFDVAFTHLEPNFFVFTEVPYSIGTGTQHFLTGAGGYVQNFLFGYPGLRIERLGELSFDSERPLLPPHGITGVTLRSLHLLNSAFTLQYNATWACAKILEQGDVPLEMRWRDGGGRRVVLGVAPFCIPIGPFKIAGSNVPEI
jgi:hypothetical protein